MTGGSVQIPYFRSLAPLVKIEEHYYHCLAPIGVAKLPILSQCGKLEIKGADLCTG